MGRAAIVGRFDFLAYPLAVRCQFRVPLFIRDVDEAPPPGSSPRRSSTSAAGGAHAALPCRPMPAATGGQPAGERVGKKQRSMRKRRGKHIGCFNKKQNANKTKLMQRPIHPDITFEDGFGNLVKSCESSLSELTKQIESELSESVVSLASFVGDTMLFECTGIFIKNLCADATSILTSPNIVGSSDYEITDNLTIKVRLPSNRVVIGWLHHCDFKYDLAVVNIRCAHGFQEAHLSSSHGMQFDSNSKLVAVGRCFGSGMLKSTNGIVIGSTHDELCELMLSTYEINTAWIGCPLIDLDGNFVGMNLRSGERTTFAPVNKILECLGCLGTVRVGSNQVVGIKEASISKTQNAGTPKDDMHAINSFEEEFVDNIWSTLSKDVALTVCRYVVSLASFNGKAKCFACTGIIVDCNPVRILTSASLVKISGDGNKIDDNLQIQVYLNNKQHVAGTLRHYDLCYNVAVVEIMGSCGYASVNFGMNISFTPNIEVLAVGCLFEPRKLMASRGVLIDGRSKLACEKLRISTCKITEAGIGGPLIDACGNLVGMNFFHDQETPYLPTKKIQEILGCFAEQRLLDDSWPEPRHRYCIPNWHSVPFGLFKDDVYYVDNLEDVYSQGALKNHM